MTGMDWEHGLFDLHHGEDPIAWAKNLTKHGWRTWIKTGVLVTINGTEVRRYTLRRERPTEQHPSS